MITAIAEVVAEGLKLANTVESNLNRPDIVAAAIKRYRQKQSDAMDAAQAVLQDPKSSAEARGQAFRFIQRIES